MDLSQGYQSLPNAPPVGDIQRYRQTSRHWKDLVGTFGDVIGVDAVVTDDFVALAIVLLEREAIFLEILSSIVEWN